MLLNATKRALPTTYALVCEISSVPGMDITAATQGRKLILRSLEVNQLNLLEELSRGEIARQLSSTLREQSSSMQSSHPGRRQKIVKQDSSSADDNSENGNSTFLDNKENHCVTFTGQTSQRPNNRYSNLEKMS